MKERFEHFVASILSPQTAVFLLGKVCLLTAVVLSYSAGDLMRRAGVVALPSAEVQIASEKKQAQRAPLSSYSVISTSNIFGTPPAAAPKVVAPPTKLKLRLVGTNLGTRQFAIIENQAKNEQDVFDQNELVFGQARLVEILADRVHLDVNGRREILIFEEGAPRVGAPTESAREVEEGQTDFTVEETELNDALSNLPVLISQVRAVPYFRDGQSIGMRLFALRRDSLWEKIGLKNGDILLAVNDNSLSDPSQALKIFEQLKSERSINVKLERNGSPTELRYNIR